MAFPSMPLAVLSCLALLAAHQPSQTTAAAHRPSPMTTTTTTTLAPSPAPAVFGLVKRLQGEGSQQCWEALVEIKSCMGEIILYLLNGEAYLEPGCCRAIRIVEHSCWAADTMLSAIGFTPEERDTLKGYCNTGHDGQNGTVPPQRATAAGNGVAAREIVDAGGE